MMMVSRWRRVFCTSIPPEPDSTAMEDLEYYQHGSSNSSSKTPSYGSRFAVFTSSTVSSPNLTCRTTASVTTPSPYENRNSLNTSWPRSPLPSPLRFLKSTLRICTRRCGLCLQNVKKGQGMATFTAECSHIFHFPCISDHVTTQGSLACPVCSCLWKEMPLFSVDHERKLFDDEPIREKLATRFMDDVIGINDEYPKQQRMRHDLKVYDDDEPLASLTPKARFNPIPETDESCDEDSIGEFQGFCVNGGYTSPVNDQRTDVEVRMLPEAAVIATSRRHETYAIALKVKAPAAPEIIQRRAPIDLVTVVDVSSKITSDNLQVIKKAMRSIVVSLSSSDRLSIVAFASHSKRLLPLRRMTPSGRRTARSIVEAMTVLEGKFNSKDAVKKAVKVLLDRRDKNPVATVILLSDFLDQSPSVSSIRYSHSPLDIRIHSLNLAVIEDHTFAKCIGNLLTVVVQDLRLQLGLISDSSPAVIAGVYQRTPQPIVLRSNAVGIGELSANEVRELLVELKLQSPAVRSHQLLSVRCRYRESFSQEIIYGKQQNLLVPHPTTVRSSPPTIQRCRNLFISARALAESRRLKEENDLADAHHTLVSARCLIQQSKPARDNELIHGLEAELHELQRLLNVQAQAQQLVRMNEKGEPLTPTSAWRVADKLAKVATMRKSVNRVSDLHGFEDARF